MPTKDNLLFVWPWAAFLAAKVDFKAAKSLSALFKSVLLARVLAGLKFNLLIILWGDGEAEEDKAAAATAFGEVVDAADVAEVAVEVAETSDIIISFVNLAIMSVEELQLMNRLVKAIKTNQRPRQGQIKMKYLRYYRRIKDDVGNATKAKKFGKGQNILPVRSCSKVSLSCTIITGFDGLLVEKGPRAGHFQRPTASQDGIMHSCRV